jgi:hypothetical protein
MQCYQGAFLNIYLCVTKIVNPSLLEFVWVIFVIKYKNSMFRFTGYEFPQHSCQ